MAHIRLASESDAAPIRAIYAPFCADESPVSFEVVAPTEPEIAGRIAATLEGHPWLVCEHGGEILGYASASQHNPRAAYAWCVNVSIYIAPAARRMGVGRTLYTSLFAALRLQGFRNAYAGVTLPNPGSVGLHRSLGFESVGIYRAIGYKGGNWHDTSWYQLSLGDHGPSPLPPRTPARLDGFRARRLGLRFGERPASREARMSPRTTPRLPVSVRRADGGPVHRNSPVWGFLAAAWSGKIALWPSRREAPPHATHP